MKTSEEFTKKMTDIVERLRGRGVGGAVRWVSIAPDLCLEAADEIERLRAESKALALGHPNVANAEILRRMEAAEDERDALACECKLLRELLSDCRAIAALIQSVVNMRKQKVSDVLQRIDAALREEKL